MKNNILKYIMIMSLVSVLLITGGCVSEQDKTAFRQISAEEAKAVMDSGKDCVILDVRTESEYAAEHIPGAILIPDFEIGERAETELPDKEQTILVYCRTGRRSRDASAELAGLGYSNVMDFGGINSWTYETEKQEE